jgi:hypothetical protein
MLITRQEAELIHRLTLVMLQLLFAYKIILMQSIHKRMVEASAVKVIVVVTLRKITLKASCTEARVVFSVRFTNLAYQSVKNVYADSIRSKRKLCA